MIVGVLDTSSDPKIAVTITRTITINKPDKASPILNFQTTSCDR